MRKTIGIMILGFLLAILAIGLWHRAHVGTAQSWQEVVRKKLLDISFEVRGWKAVKWTASNVRNDKVKDELRGSFAADSDCRLAVMDEENFGRLRSGFPPVPIAVFTPGAVSINEPSGAYWFVFFQEAPKKEKEAFPTTGLQLGLLLLRSLAEANQPPAHITAELDQIISVYATPDEVAAVRARFSEPPQPAAEKPRPPADTGILGDAIEVKPPTN